MIILSVILLKDQVFVLCFDQQLPFLLLPVNLIFQLPYYFSSSSLLITFMESNFNVIGIGTADSNNSIITSSFCLSILTTLAFSLLNGPDIISTISFFFILT